MSVSAVITNAIEFITIGQCTGKRLHLGKMSDYIDVDAALYRAAYHWYGHKRADMGGDNGLKYYDHALRELTKVCDIRELQFQETKPIVQLLKGLAKALEGVDTPKTEGRNHVTKRITRHQKKQPTESTFSDWAGIQGEEIVVEED